MTQQTYGTQRRLLENKKTKEELCKRTIPLCMQGVDSKVLHCLRRKAKKTNI